MHILDGGGHSVTMNHFASTILKNMDINIKSYEIELHKKYSGVKMIKSLKENVENLCNEVKPGDFIAIPASASTLIPNLEAGIRKLLHKLEFLTPENIASKRKIIIDMLEKIASNKDNPPPAYIDSNGQGFEYLPDLIKSINELVNKGVNVYIPAGHPADYTIKYIFEEMDDKHYLYRYIATGKDPEEKVKNVLENIKRTKLQMLNLLGLSNAHFVTLEGLDKNNYIFGDYNSLVTDKVEGFIIFLQ